MIKLFLRSLGSGLLAGPPGGGAARSPPVQFQLRRGLWAVAVPQSPSPLHGQGLCLLLWEGDVEDLPVVLHEVDLQALGDEGGQVVEVLLVLSRQDDARHPGTLGLGGGTTGQWGQDGYRSPLPHKVRAWWAPCSQWP